jgi:iron(II)-dependent oxidoreductase
MIPPQTLGALANAHELIVRLVEQCPARDVNRSPDGRLASAGWLLGRAVYLETYLLREKLLGDDDLSSRVRHLFGPGIGPGPEIDAMLPPLDHLLNWAMEIFDHHLTLLANPGLLPEHPWLHDGWLPAWLVQRHALVYEAMLSGQTARSMARHRDDFAVEEHRLEPILPRADAVRVDQGHYRIGARDGVVMDCEQPVQIVELHSFRIQRLPVSNAEYLAFIQDGGYQSGEWWDEQGAAWLAQTPHRAPWNWRQDMQGEWYAIGMNGAMNLHAGEPVSGLSAHEANAFAAWASAKGEGLSGAVPQHEYQWETAARMGLLEGTGRAWEWCANAFHAYDGYEAPKEPELATRNLEQGHISLRGASLHTQPSLRRASFRRGAAAEQNTLFAGTRLVLPPGKAAWE